MFSAHIALAGNSDNQSLSSPIISPEKSVPLDGDQAEQLLQQAETLFHLDNGAGCIAFSTKAIAINPKIDRAYYLRGIAYSNLLDDDEKALEDFRQAVRLKPADKFYWEQFGRSCFYVGHDKEAIDALTKSIILEDAELTNSKDKDHSALTAFYSDLHIRKTQALKYYLRAMAYNEIHQRENALKDFDQAISFDQKVPPIRLDWIASRGTLLSQMGKKDKARRDYELIKSDSVTMNTGLVERINLAFELGLYTEAVAGYKAIKDINFEDDSGGLRARADAAGTLGFFQDALCDYQRIQKMRPDEACIYNNIACYCLEIGRWRESISLGQKCILLKPQHADHYANLADVEAAAGLMSLAQAHADKALAIADMELENNSGNLTALIARAVSLRIKKRYQAALETGQKIEAIDQEAGAVSQAHSYQSMGKFDRALQYFDKALSKSRSNDLRYHRGQTLKRLGRKIEGEADMKAATAAGYIEPRRGQ